jgi:SHS family lactate transporter-like MFS transporter
MREANTALSATASPGHARRRVFQSTTGNERGTSERPWYAHVTADERRAFAAMFFGWVAVGFDFTILTFVLIDVQNGFTIDRALAGALGTATLGARLLGGVVSGVAADTWGRKLPVVFSVLWFSIFACLSGFSTSYAMLFGLRALFGIGMGGLFASGMPLAIEHWPTRLRGFVSGLLQGGFACGFIVSAAVFQFIYPAFRGNPDLGWRVMMWAGIVPIVLAVWICRRVGESPVWVEGANVRHNSVGASRATRISLFRIFGRELAGTTLQTSVLMGALMFMYYSISFWYATFLREAGLPTLRYLVGFNMGSITGHMVWGYLADGVIGRRGAVTVAAFLIAGAIPLYLQASSPWMLWIGAVLMGGFGGGIFGIVPAYLAERFPTTARAAGMGFVYHAGAGIGGITPALVGLLQDRGTMLTTAMSTCIAASSLLVASLIWLGPETRARRLTALDIG